MHDVPILPAAISPPPESLEAAAPDEAPALPFEEIFEAMEMALEEPLEELLSDQMMALMPSGAGILPQEPVEVIIHAETGKTIPVEASPPWLSDLRQMLPEIPNQPVPVAEMPTGTQLAEPIAQGKVELALGDQAAAEELKLNLENQKPAIAKPLETAQTPVPVELEPVQSVESVPVLKTSSAKEVAVAPLENQPEAQQTDLKVSQPKVEAATQEVSETAKPQVRNQVETTSEPEVTTNVAGPQMQVSKTFQAGELARTAEARPAQIIEQVSSTLETLVNSGQTSLRLQLHPEHLGRIDLQLNSGSEGLQVWITPDAASTSQVLQAEVQNLKQSMQEAGVTLTDVNIGPGSQQHEAPKPFDAEGHSELRLDEEIQPEAQQNERLQSLRESASTHEYLI